MILSFVSTPGIPGTYRSKEPKAVVIGLDCFEPALVFERFRGQLANLERLAEGGLSGRLRGTDPPGAGPDWAVMLSGMDASVLGLNGLGDHSHAEPSATDGAASGPWLWDHLAPAGKRVILLGIPQACPPQPVNGIFVGCAPAAETGWTHPPGLREEIARLVHPCEESPDLSGGDPARLREALFRMTHQRFTLARYFLRTRPWEFFLMLESGGERVHRAFWGHMDLGHRKHRPGDPWEHVVRDYYRLVDDQVGKLLQEVPANAAVLVVSAQGARRRDADDEAGQASPTHEGMYVLNGPGVAAGKRWDGGRLLDVAPTLLKVFGLPTPPEMPGKPFPIEALGFRCPGLVAQATSS